MSGLVRSTRAGEHATLAALAAGMPAKGAEWVGWIASWQVCFASMAAASAAVGRSARQAFRYQALAMELCLVVSQPGDRDNPPDAASVPYPLRMHGYAIRRVVGELGDTCRDIGRSVWESVQRKKSQKAAIWAAQKARERAARDAEHRDWQAKHPYPDRKPVGDLLGQTVARATMPKREPVRRSMTAEQLDAELEAIPWDKPAPGKPPPE